jgi:hypothetical protein
MDLRTATNRTRRDWDLSTPGLRDAWNAGDLSQFHGWNKHASHLGPLEEGGIVCDTGDPRSETFGS